MRLDPQTPSIWQEHAVVLPLLMGTDQSRAGGLLIAGLNPLRLYDENHESFLEQVAGAISTAIANAQALPRITQVQELEREVQVRSEALRESEARMTFLLALSDTLRPLKSVVDIQQDAARLLRQKLALDWCYYVEFKPGDTAATVLQGSTRPGLGSLVGRASKVLPKYAGELRAGNMVIVSDAGVGVRIRALLAVPLVKDGTLSAALVMGDNKPRAWTKNTIALVGETAERTWIAVERARAESVQHETEERFRQFGNASSDGLWIRDAHSFALEYASPAMESVYGVSIEALRGDEKLWAALITPDDRPRALQQLERVRQGESVTHEFRILRPPDHSFHWIRTTAFPLLDAQGRVQRLAGICSDVTETKQLAVHQSMLLAELQHRVRNLMALIKSLTLRTAQRAHSVSEYADLLSGRLLTLARVQTLLTRTANDSVNFAEIVRQEVSAQAGHDAQYQLRGPDLEISPKATEVMTLALHELATNAVKYGALSVASGRVEVRWESFERHGAAWVGLDWVESGGPAPTSSSSRHRGLGSELIEELLPYELGGEGRLRLEPGGAHCRLEFPLGEGSSVLETNAPQKATVFGGSIDMAGAADLSGSRILVVEDDYYLASDVARAIHGAGGKTLGPCATERIARALLRTSTPSAAVLDINLGDGPCYRLAKLLKQRGVPYVFMTGHQDDVIPAELKNVVRLEKPVELRRVVDCLAKALKKAAA